MRTSKRFHEETMDNRPVAAAQDDQNKRDQVTKAATKRSRLGEFPPGLSAQHNPSHAARSSVESGRLLQNSGSGALDEERRGGAALTIDGVITNRIPTASWVRSFLQDREREASSMLDLAQRIQHQQNMSTQALSLSLVFPPNIGQEISDLAQARHLQQTNIIHVDPFLRQLMIERHMNAPEIPHHYIAKSDALPSQLSPSPILLNRAIIAQAQDALNSLGHLSSPMISQERITPHASLRSLLQMTATPTNTQNVVGPPQSTGIHQSTFSTDLRPRHVDVCGPTRNLSFPGFSQHHLTPQVSIANLKSGAASLNSDPDSSKTVPSTALKSPPFSAVSNDQPSPSTDGAASRVQRKTIPMSLGADRYMLNSFQKLLREQLLFFESDVSDLHAPAQGRTKPIQVGQVGILCRHCQNILPRHRPKGAAYFPHKLLSIYQSAQNMAKNHYFAEHNSCRNIPDSVLEDLRTFKNQKVILSGGGPQYWAEAAETLGVIETDEGGVRFASEE